MTRRWFTVADAAEYLGVSKDFVRRLIYAGLPCYKVRGITFVKATELDKAIESGRL